MSLELVRDVLNSKPFQTADMSEAVNDVIPYTPGQVTGLNIFNEEPLFTDVAYVEERAGKLKLIPSSVRGGPSEQITPVKRGMRPIQTFRLSEMDRINASELFKVTQFHSQAALQNLTTVRNQRLSQLAANMDLTMEHLHLNALKGDVRDADGSTSLTNLFTLFGVSQQAEVAFDLGNTTAGTLTKKLAAIWRTIANILEMDSLMIDHIHVMCSPEFMDDLVVNKDVIDWAKAAAPNGQYSTWLTESRVFGVLRWQKFMFEEYRIGTTAAAAGGSWIDADKCIIFPVGPKIYTTFFSPGEFFGALDGTPGLPRYARAAADTEWDEYVDLKLQSYPLPICTRPGVLMKGKRGS